MASASITNQNALHCVAAQYDFAVHGGAVGDIGLRIRVPKASIIVNVIARIHTAPTSGGSATIAVKAESAGDLFAQGAIGSAPWSSTGNKLGVPDIATVGNYAVTTAEREITMTIGTAALTAGKIDFYVMYLNNATA